MGSSRSYILDDGRKVRYWLGEWTNSKTDTTYYIVEVSVYERRRSLLSLGMKRWKRVESEQQRRVDHNEDAAREAMKECRAIAVGEESHPLDKLLDEILADVEPNHNP